MSFFLGRTPTFERCFSQSLSITSSTVQFSRSVISDSLRPHESQDARPPCPSPTPGVHPDSRPSGQWCHPAISSSVIPFSSYPQSLSASESFPISQLFAWGMDPIKILTGFFKNLSKCFYCLGENARIAFKNTKNVTNDKLFLPDTKNYFRVQ